MGSDPLPHLPEEVWVLIFRKCSMRDLQSFRLVCPYWNKIVTEHRSLNDQLMVRFNELEIFDACVPTRLPPVGKASLRRCWIWTVKEWWPDFGNNLMQLSLNECRIATPELLEMLRGCPNLREFQLWHVGLIAGRVDDVDFQLESLEKFDLVGLSSCRGDSMLLDYFGQIFARLKSFSLYDPEDLLDEAFTAKLMSFLETVKGTLQALLLPMDNGLLKKLCEVDQLNLRQAEFEAKSRNWDINLWSRFCQNQRYLTDIHLWGRKIDDEVLNAIVRNTASLKRLTTELTSFQAVNPITFLSYLTAVEHVTIDVAYQDITLSAHFSPCLKSLHLQKANLIEGIEFIMNSPHLEELTLIDCDISRCPLPEDPKPFSNLKRINFDRLINSYSRLEYITSCHSTVEAISFAFMKSVRVDTIVTLLLMSPRLNQIKLVGCPRFLAASVGEEIMEHYHNVTGTPERDRVVNFIVL